MSVNPPIHPPDIILTKTKDEQGEEIRYASISPDSFAKTKAILEDKLGHRLVFDKMRAEETVAYKCSKCSADIFMFPDVDWESGIFWNATVEGYNITHSTSVRVYCKLLQSLV